MLRDIQDSFTDELKRLQAGCCQISDLGKSEATAGLTFVCISRAKSPGDLLVKSMPSERFSELGKKTYISAKVARGSAS